MKIKLLNRMAGPDGNFPSGFVLDLNERDAAELVRGKYAEALEPFPVKADVLQSERADNIKKEEKKTVKKAVK